MLAGFGWRGGSLLLVAGDRVRELARHVGADEGLEVADHTIGDEDDGQVVALARGLAHHEVERGLVARHVQPRPGVALCAEELLDANELTHVHVLLEIDEDRGRILLGHRRRARLRSFGRAAGAQRGEARAGASALGQLVERSEGAAERRVETTYEVLLDTHGGEPVASRAGHCAIEGVADSFEHAGPKEKQSGGRVKARGVVEGARPLSRCYPDRMFEGAAAVYASVLGEIRAAGLEKHERQLLGAQGASIQVGDASEPVLNFCANNYLGLSSDPRVLAAARAALDTYGYGLSSVRFICGTQDAHKRLESALARFLGMEDAILYSSCFDANGGLFETLLDERDAIVSDALNHASIIDGVRLCQAERHRYAHGDMAALEDALEKAKDKRLRMIATDGVFSMDGDLAPLERICDLADRYRALVMVDDSHATGFIGRTGRGSIEHCGVMGRVDIVTSTLGKALGGAAGGFTASRREVVELLRQRSRPYLFSNSLAPAIVGASLAVLERLDSSDSAAPTLAEKVLDNARRFREGMAAAGFRLRPGFHPIAPVMMSGPRADSGGDARLAQEVAAAMLAEGIYVVGFSYPVVPRGLARIRVQLSAAHTAAMVDRAIDAFTRVGKRFDLI